MSEAPAASTTKPPSAPSPPAPNTGRLIGLDVARGLAVLGMFAAHAGPTGWLYTLASGRSAALFAVLAGVSLALLSGGSQPVTGRNRTATAARIAVRAAVLFVIGLVLTTLNVPAMVILAFYGVLFVLSIPVLRLRTTALATLAAVFAVAGPIASFLIRSTTPPRKIIGYTPGLADFTSLDGLAHAFRALLLTGAYPVLTWIPFLLAGMALGRLDLRAVRGRLVGIGAALGLLGYGTSWLALNVFGGFERILALHEQFTPELVRMVLRSNYGVVPTEDPIYLLTAGAHSGTPFEVIGATGVATAVIGLCLLAEPLRGALTPLASVGALALTAYVGHLLVLKALGPDHPTQLLEQHPYVPLVLLVLATLALTTAWRLLLGRGPLEWGLHHLSSGPAKLIRRGGNN
ncbi:putative membrane protein YeiB [Actinopolyspora biskrensis]|uniref:Putative membrane protein YeiB n=1 Tax=Actinopolyspora biskrensis TaxID=1470178 RepID=A0A852YU44_9ACTN|nr:DUF418 domain-containing protein [Actinopolyspora biskrensis]NYH77488.1 putative membrane protein YeiB [Actinopolyspora biskrensis]